MMLVFVFIAAVLNAMMDILENENFSSSIFARLDPKFWYKRESWKWARRIGGWKFDGWHVAKSLMVMVLLWAAAEDWVQWLLMGIVWNVTFNLSYKLFKG